MPARLIIPEALRGTIMGIRVPTPVSDELEQRLADYVARLEAQSPDGKHPVARALAFAVGYIRAAEVTLENPSVTEEDRGRAREAIDWGRRQLDRLDVGELLRRFGGERHH